MWSELMNELTNWSESRRAKRINAMRARVANGTATADDLKHYHANKP